MTRHAMVPGVWYPLDDVGRPGSPYDWPMRSVTLEPLVEGETCPNTEEFKDERNPFAPSGYTRYVRVIRP
ncbi:MAG: hypothetical protein ACXWHZ_03635 [Usitatibacter sp.]